MRLRMSSLSYRPTRPALRRVRRRVQFNLVYDKVEHWH